MGSPRSFDKAVKENKMRLVRNRHAIISGVHVTIPTRLKQDVAKKERREFKNSAKAICPLSGGHCEDVKDDCSTHCWLKG